MNKLKFITIVFVMTINVALYYRQNTLSANCNPISKSSNQNDTCNLKKQDTLHFNNVHDVFIKYNLKS